MSELDKRKHDALRDLAKVMEKHGLEIWVSEWGGVALGKWCIDGENQIFDLDHAVNCDHTLVSEVADVIAERL